MKIKFKQLVYILIIFSSILWSQTWFEQHTIDNTILLEKKNGDEFIPHGTGFLLYNYKETSHFVLITCAHVLRNKDIYITYKADSSIINEMNKIGAKYVIMGNNRWILDGVNLRAKINLIDGRTFIKHDSLDIAGFQISIAKSMKLISETDTTNIDVTTAKGIPKSLIMHKEKVKLGQDVYFLGFPFMIGTKPGYMISSNAGSIPTGNYKDEVSNPVLRTGTISWISSNNKEFLIDAFSYGGNSGSPVFTKKGFGEKGPYLIGMVIGHLGEEVDLSVKKNNNKLNIDSDVIGNAGLARCLWIDDILEVAKKVSEL